MASGSLVLWGNRGLIDMGMLTRFFKDTAGATAVEYGLIAALISVAMMGALGLIGNNISNMLVGVANKMTSP